MTDVEKIEQALKDNEQLRSIHSDALDDLQKIRSRATLSPGKVSMGLSPRARRSRASEISKEREVVSDAEKINKYTNFLMDCGIFGEDIDSFRFDVSFIENKIEELYLIKTDHATVEKLVAGRKTILDYLMRISRNARADKSDFASHGNKVAQPTAPDELNDDSDFQATFMQASTASELGKILRAERERKELSQVEVAKIMGTDHRAVRRIESGETNPSWETACRFAKALGANIGLFRSVDNE